MKKLYDIILKIRDCVNELDLFETQFQNNYRDWNKLCAAMDIIEDTCEACLVYEKNGLGEGIGEKYLRVYGLLQSIYLQQDAIKILAKILANIEIVHDKLANWKRIRDIRNMSTGHPIEYNYGEKSIFLSRVTITDNNFQLLVWDNNTEKDKFLDIDLANIYQEYIKEGEVLLNEVIGSIKN